MSEKILIVDDDIDSLKLIGLMLQRQGYEVIAANAGHQALSKAQSNRPDLIILDIMMPDMDGYEVCRRLRADSQTAHIPIIMFTAKTLVDDKVAGFEAGADDYLTKPTHPAELASRVKSMLARNTDNNPQRASDKGATIGFIGAKGGVGTSTLALNIAAAMQSSEQSPLITDFRPGCGSLGLMLGMDHAANLTPLLTRPTKELQPANIEQELLVHASGLRALLSSPHPAEAQLHFEIESALTLIKSLRQIAAVSVFDLGAVYTPLIARLQQEMDQIIVVLEPTSISLELARNILTEITKGNNNPHVSAVVVNRVSSKQIAWNEVETALGWDLSAVISAAPDAAARAVQSATPIVLHQPNTIISTQLTKLAENISVRLASGRNPTNI